MHHSLSVSVMSTTGESNTRNQNRLTDVYKPDAIQLLPLLNDCCISDVVTIMHHAFSDDEERSILD